MSTAIKLNSTKSETSLSPRQAVFTNRGVANVRALCFTGQGPVATLP